MIETQGKLLHFLRKTAHLTEVTLATGFMPAENSKIRPKFSNIAFVRRKVLPLNFYYLKAVRDCLPSGLS